MTTDQHAPAEPPSLSCDEAVDRLWDYLDRALPAVDMAAVHAHLSACRKCPPHFEFERRLLEEIRAAAEGFGASDALRERVLAIVGGRDGIGGVDG